MSIDQGYNFYNEVIPTFDQEREDFESIWYQFDFSECEGMDHDWCDTSLDSWNEQGETIFEEAGLVPSDNFATIEDLFNYMDLDGNGYVNYKEGCVAVASHTACLDSDDFYLDAPFWMIDVDSSGELTPDEISRLTDDSSDSEEAYAWAEWCDTDGS